jgi:hypothetical protein
MNVEKPGQYKTRNGGIVLVWGFKPDFIAPDSYVVFGSLLMRDGTWNDLTWTVEGHFTMMRNTEEVENDLVEYVGDLSNFYRKAHSVGGFM